MSPRIHIRCLVEGYSHVQTVTEVLQTIRNKAEEEFHKLYSVSEAMAKIAGANLSMHRICGRQTQRSNVMASDLESYVLFTR